MQPTITTITAKKFIGMKASMSLIQDTTFKLFSTFMPRRKEVATIAAFIYDLKEYPENYFNQFNPAAVFTKWALVEVSDVNDIPDEMEAFYLEAGLYAVFKHKGQLTDNSIFTYIFTEWLPKSGYIIDNRPHFDVMHEKNKTNDTNAVQEIWIPIQERTN